MISRVYLPKLKMQYPNKKIHNALKEDQLRVFYKRLYEVLLLLDQVYISVGGGSVETYKVDNKFPADYRVFFEELEGLSISSYSGAWGDDYLILEIEAPILNSTLINDFEGAIDRGETSLFKYPGYEWGNKEDDFYYEKDGLQFKDILVLGWSNGSECYCFDKRSTPHQYFSEEHAEGALYKETFLDRLLDDISFVLDERRSFNAKPAWEYIYNGNLEKLNSYKKLVRDHFVQEKILDFFSSKLFTYKNEWVLNFTERRAILDVIEHFTQNKSRNINEARKWLELIKTIDVTDLLIFKETIKKGELFHTILEGKEKETIYKQFYFFIIETKDGVDTSMRIISEDTAKGLKEFAKKR